MYDLYEDIETAVLPNGLTVHVAHWPNRPWVAAGFVVHSGARLDQVGLEGTAHFVEHLVSRNGSISYDNINRFFDRIGGSVYLGATSYRATIYKFFSPTTHAELHKALSIFGEMLFSLKLENFIEEQRKVIESEFFRKWPNPVLRDLTWEKNRDLFRGTWLERYITPLGDPGSVSRIGQIDLQSYYDTHYTPANVSVVFVGGLSLSEVVAYLSEGPFAVRKDGARSPLPDIVSDFPTPQETRRVFEISKHIQMSQAIEKGEYESSVIIPGIVRWPVLGIMMDMMNQVLFNEVRERLGWTYSINVSKYNHQPFHESTIKCVGIPLYALEQIEGVIETCVQSIGDKDDMFGEVVHSMLSNMSQLDMSGRDFRDRLMNDLCVDYKFDTTAQDRLEISKVTMTDVKETLKWFVPHRRKTYLTIP